MEIADRAEVSRPTVLAWRRQFEADGLIRFGQVAKGRGRKPSIPDETIAEITTKAIRRGTFGSVDDLVAAIDEYLRVHNEDPKPFVWTATAEQILDKVRRARATLNSMSF